MNASRKGAILGVEVVGNGVGSGGGGGGGGVSVLVGNSQLAEGVLYRIAAW